MTMADRFWTKVAIGEPESCWPWTAAVQRGYGAFFLNQPGVGRVQANAQRVAYVLTYGPIPDGLHILHSCDNTICCNPAHLSAGNRSENAKQAHERGRYPIGQRASHRLTDEERGYIGEQLRTGVSVRAVARELDVRAATVRRVRETKAGRGQSTQQGIE